MNAKLKAGSLLIYQEDLICIDNEDFKPTGDFGKKILVIADKIEAESEEQQLLDKMLKATALGIEDIYLLKLDNKAGLLPYINKLKPENIICFGAHLDTHSARFSKRLYEVQKIIDNQILIANNLSKIIESSDDKQALWNGLKKMFNL